jgi:hypothetical protein
MECKITFTKSRRLGAAVAEWVVSVGIGGLLLATMAAFSVHGARTFVTLSNYSDLNGQSRIAVDKMGQEIRQALKVTSYAPEQITVLVGTNYVTYAYLANERKLTRQVVGQPTQTLLTGCDSARFDIFQRQATNTELSSAVSGILSLLPLSVDPIYPKATTDNAKIVQLTWNCSRSILGKKANTEAAQFARIVIRKQTK